MTQTLALEWVLELVMQLVMQLHLVFGCRSESIRFERNIRLETLKINRLVTVPNKFPSERLILMLEETSTVQTYPQIASPTLKIPY